MVKIFGEKEKFAIGYEIEDFKEAKMNVYVNNKPICTFIKNGVIHELKWSLDDIVEWLETNIEYILHEEGFPLPVEGNSAIEIYNKSCGFESDDEAFDDWHEKRQEWSFRHSWYSSRAGSYLAEIYFRRIGESIEISWDNDCLYDNIEFINPKGMSYVNSNLFEKVIKQFIKTYRMDMQEKY